MALTTKILCIPRVESCIAKDFITNTINNYELGKIKKIIEIPHKNNPDYKRVIVHIYLQKNSNTEELENRFALNKDIKMIYNFPWYWKIVEANQITK